MKRPVACVLVAVCLAVLLGSGAALAGGGMRLDATFASALRKELNRERLEHGLEPLPRLRALARVARSRVRALARKGVFGHGAVEDRIRRQLGLGSTDVPVGEAIYWSSGKALARDVVDAFLASPRHRRALLRRGWTGLGIGAVRAADAPGFFGGDDVVIVVVDYAALR